MWWWRRSKIHADSSLETHSNEQPNHMLPKISSEDVIKYVSILATILIIVATFVAVVLIVMHELRSHDQSDTQICFSIVSVSISELNPNASSTPFFSIVYQVEKAFENDIEMRLHSMSTTISYHGIEIARAAKDESLYYIENDWTVFVVPVPMLASVPTYLHKQLWEERQKEIAVLDLEMDFQAADGDEKNYHVWCNNVTLRAVDTPILCNVTM